MATLAQRPVMAPLPMSTPHRVCRAVGWAMMVIGVLGFAAPLLLGMHLGFLHSVLYIVAGAFALWHGQNATTERAVRFSWILGAVFAFLGIIGLVIGEPGVPAMGNVVESTQDPFLLEVIPGWLEFGRWDHVAHLVLGTALLLSAVFWKGETARPGAAK